MIEFCEDQAPYQMYENAEKIQKQTQIKIIKF